MEKLCFYFQLCLITFALQGASCQTKEEPDNIPSIQLNTAIPLEGNGWFFRDPRSPGEEVYDLSGQTWTDSGLILRTYFYVHQPGELHFGLKAKTGRGSSFLSLRFGDNNTEMEINSREYEETYAGTYHIDSPGYYHIDIKGLSKEGPEYASISDILLGGTATGGGVNFSDEDFFYWGRRGPSVHLRYEIPEEADDIKWFYNEVTVPEGCDVIGSFFMANGFSEGYFGFQVNSPDERRILFSVWSPYETDDPGDIPEEYRINLLKKGDGVITMDFGNEGSGGQSFLKFNWQAGTTYRFLLKVEPAGNDKTDYTAYFFAPEADKWELIASWRRPFIDTYARGLHSFLENFSTRTGPLMRQAAYSNQWVYDVNGRWHEITGARFSADATARAGARLDFGGGTFDDKTGFFLKNCGFFDQATEIGSYFTRNPTGQEPEIDFTSLP
ncbi:MAG: DUF3472 domain-containing protein [Bacteroidales bacterium]